MPPTAEFRPPTPWSSVLRAALALGLGLVGATALAAPPEELGPTADAQPPAPTASDETMDTIVGPERPSSTRAPEGERGFLGPDFSAEGAQESLIGAADPVRALFEMPPSARDDAYGPRPDGVPALSREQIVRYSLENPYVKAAEEHVEAMESLLLRAKFAWVPVIKTSAVLSPGAAIECDDITVEGQDGPFSFQYCRASGDPADGTDPVDLQTVEGYFERIGAAGIALRMQADFVVPITTFGKIVAAKQGAQKLVELAEYQTLATQHETVLQVYQAHAALQLARQSIGILHEAWSILGQERRKIQLDLGLGPDGTPRFDVDPSELNPDRDPDDLTRLEVGEIELAGRMREARMIESKALATLWTMAGSAAPKGFDITDEPLAPDTIEGGLADLDHYKSLALGNRPEAKLADGGVEARRVQEKIARTNFLPDLGVIVRLGYGYANKATEDMRTLYYSGRLNFSNIYFGLGLTWNLDFHNDAFALRKARAERREAEYQRDAAKALLVLEVEDAYRAVLDAEQQMAFAELARDKSWRLVVSEQTSQSIGASDFDDLRKALTKWAEFEFQHFEAIMNRNIALAKLSRAVGTPLTAP